MLIVQMNAEIPQVLFVERVDSQNTFDGYVCAAKESSDNTVLIELDEEGKERAQTCGSRRCSRAATSSTSFQRQRFKLCRKSSRFHRCTGWGRRLCDHAATSGGSSDQFIDRDHDDFEER